MTLEDKFAEYVKWPNIGQYLALDQQFFRLKNQDTMVVSRAIGPISAGSDFTLGSVPDVNPEEGILYAFLIGIQGRFAFSVNQPSATQKWGSITASRGFLDFTDSPLIEPSPQTFTVTIRQHSIDLILRNLDSVAQTAIVRFQGYKYELEPVTGPMTQRLQIMLDEGRLPWVRTQGIAKNIG
jgi:hypothetical protein